MGKRCKASHPASSGSGALVLALFFYAGAALAQPVAVSPSVMPQVATVDQRFQSYNVEMAEVIGGNFWKPYHQNGDTAQKLPQTTNGSPVDAGNLQAGQSPTMFEPRAPIDLTNARLRRLAAALGPAYLRVSGTWANTVFFHDSDAPAPASPPPGFQGVLTRPEWKGVIDFAHVVNARLLTSFAISAGVRDTAGVWTPDQARKLLAYTKAIAGEVAAAEFFNEPTMPEYGGAPPGYDAAAYARDFAVFQSFAKETVPEMRTVGPAAVGEAVLLPAMSGKAPSILKSADLLAANPPPLSDVFSYHFYGAASVRCTGMGSGAQTTADAALSDEWLSRADRSYVFYSGLRDRFEPGKPIWITETADAACGGNPWANTFLDTFRYLDQHARLARDGVSVVFHNTLASSEYGLLDQNTFAPRPNYWAALLWHRLMGPNVLNPGPSRHGLNLYAQCLPGHPGGVTLLAINTSREDSRSIELPIAAERYTLAAEKLEANLVQLNGEKLELSRDGELPTIKGQHIARGQVELAPASITFLAMQGAANENCP
jgi:heparanase